jgi:hypothetical protein
MRIPEEWPSIAGNREDRTRLTGHLTQLLNRSWPGSAAPLDRCFTPRRTLASRRPGCKIGSSLHPFCRNSELFLEPLGAGGSNNRMKHFASRAFWDAYDKLPAEIRKLADRKFALLKTDPKHPSLHFKKVGRTWSVRIGLHFRAIATEVDGNMRWHWIGSHADYDYK